MVIIKHPTSRIDSSFFRGAHSGFVTQEDRPAEKTLLTRTGLVVRVQTPDAPAEDDVEANERGTNERGARENPCADFVAPITRARERRRRLARAPGARELAFTRFRGEPRSRVFRLRDAVATCANLRTTPRP